MRTVGIYNSRVVPRPPVGIPQTDVTTAGAAALLRRNATCSPKGRSPCNCSERRSRPKNPTEDRGRSHQERQNIEVVPGSHAGREAGWQKSVAALAVANGKQFVFDHVHDRFGTEGLFEHGCNVQSLLELLGIQIIGIGGEKDDRSLCVAAILSKQLTKLAPRHDRHLLVRNDKIKDSALGSDPGLPAITRNIHAKPCPLEAELQPSRDNKGIFDDEDIGSGDGYSPVRVRSTGTIA